MKSRNPFVIEGYSGKEYFCDREQETSDMLTALGSRRNLTLISPRRMGKTGLIKHVFSIAAATGVKCFYMDILNTRNLKDFIQTFARTLLGGMDGPVTSAFNTFAKFFKSCRPTLSPDEMTGMPTLSLEIRPGEETHSLQEVFAYLNEKDQECHIAIDEFQQIMEYPEANVEALLRSHIQFAKSATFIFAGSRQHLMREMFTSPARPFFQSTQSMPLKAIDRNAYYSFAAGWFKKAGRNLPKECFDAIYTTVMGHTWYIQYWLSILYDYSSGDVSMTDVDFALSKILALEDDNFYQYMALMTKAQQRIAIAIAMEGTVEKPYSQAFIGKYGLPATSTVKSSMAQLAGKEILMEDRGAFSVYNRFFMLWLRRNGKA